jgi:hypothetical protein
MADETKEGETSLPREERGGGKGGKGGTATATKGGTPGTSGKGKDKAPAGAVDHTPKAAEGTPRLQEYYDKTIRSKLAKEFGLSNPNQVPRLVKIVLNVGMGDAGKNPKQL